MTSGRLTTYTQHIADKICARLEAGETLRAICRDDDMPAEAAVRKWAFDDRQGFYAQYTKAREIGYMSMADELVEISRNTRRGVKRTIKSDGTEEIVESDAVDRSRLHSDTLKWLLSKALPKIYGMRRGDDPDDDTPLQNRPDGL